MEASAAAVYDLLVRHELSPGRAYIECLRSLAWTSFQESVQVLCDASWLNVSSVEGLAKTFRRHSVAEFSGAGVLAYVANNVRLAQMRSDLLAHASDERRHSAIFEALAALLSDERSDNYRPDDPFIERYQGDYAAFFCDTHFAEIRNISYLNWLIHVIRLEDRDTLRKIRRGLTSIIEDEERHVVQTALYLDVMFDTIPEMNLRLIQSHGDYIKSIKYEAESIYR